MGIYIQNVEMRTDGEVVLRINHKGEAYVYGRYPTEPHKAVSIPPHGRLIDADDFIRQLSDGSVSNAIRSGISYRMSKMPTIIEAEEENE